MKAFGVMMSFMAASLQRRNVKLLAALLAAFALLVAAFTVIFQVLMSHEGQSHSWPAAVYWTLVTMTTLGFGDITFQEDSGRIFSVVVLLSGFGFLLVLLPFSFIQFVVNPWMAMREASRAPRALPADTSDHLVLIHHGAIEDALIRRAAGAGVGYVTLVSDVDEAVRLHDQGYRVMLGDLDDPATYLAARVEYAALVAVTGRDTTNTNVTYTVREISDDVPIIATAASPASTDILELAGADDVLQLGDMLGEAMARRTLGADGRSHPIGEFAGLVIAEANVSGTELVGQTLAEAQLRSTLGIGVIGVSERGNFEIARPSTRLAESTVVILAATAEQLAAYDRRFAVPSAPVESVIIIGGGRVGRAAGRALERNGSGFRIIEQQHERIRDPDQYVLGDAAELAVLEAAGLRTSSSLVITTHDDDMNVYLAIYGRRLRPDIHIVARANLDRNVSTLYRAGADAVLSYASTGSTAIWNHFRPDDTMLVAEGLNVFRVPMPTELAGKTLGDTHVRATTGCNVVALDTPEGTIGNPAPSEVLRADAELVLIGDADAEARFAAHYDTTALRRRIGRPRRLVRQPLG